MAKRICSIEECGLDVKGYGYCRKHYRRWKKHGDPNLGAAKPPLGLSEGERRERARQRASDWYYANRERARANVKAYKEADPERKRRLDREYRLANRERIDQRVKEWNAANRERRREIARKYSHKPELRERRAAASREWRAANLEKARAQKAARYAINIEKSRAEGRKYTHLRKARKYSVQTVPFTQEQWEAKVAYWGDQCWMCGGDWSHMDHVKPISAGGADMLCNLRPACGSCNSRKHNKWPYPTVRIQLNSPVSAC